MTDAEIIGHLAEKVMGWHVNDGIWCSADNALGPFVEDWNPLESIADAFEVQAKVPSDQQRTVGVEVARMVKESKDGLWSSVSDWDMLNITARARCIAIVDATR